ncbi:Rieske 2Fe-2S domain-containing protein [Thioalkalivibrio paradoxus]|uniref:Carboxymuconolactone decarboxylase n=1 Tax=Thioalkalivibrio paradoxus ARh 1 TaxID=713585 RepID=W0DEI9_9GAMM|nr:Rieske 2Fe-2S domain-containing protein [Thioalkalivibrio paradoxus]AHE97059.1 carboxymuconolactone decarboxylase [Thioalkalivibrio paradoxus ARh 1]
MSDALNYLVQVRGDALGHYFKFLKDAGKHLDPKTRNLISVITKVHSQTEAGFKQYLMRALREGCTPMEVIDALMMAFPALGLAKVVWATEIILEMDIPEFSPELIAAEPQWRDVMAADDIVDGEVLRVESATRTVFVYREGDSYRVYDSHCPHQVTNIPHLALEGMTLTCPKHQWKFDIRTGDCIAKGKHPMKAFETRVADGRLLAWW